MAAGGCNWQKTLTGVYELAGITAAELAPKAAAPFLPEFVRGTGVLVSILVRARQIIPGTRQKQAEEAGLTGP